MGEPDYLIHQLAQRAGVSVRTVRFYIDEGLLPPPPTRGRYAVYGDDYLERLELIRLLKARFLPLKEIRARLEGLSGSQVRAALREEQRRAASRPARGGQAPAQGSSALEYIDQLLNQQQAPRIRDAKQAYAPARAHLFEQPAPSAGQTWARIPLADGVELHIRQPLEPTAQEALERLLDYAQHLFNRSI